MADSITAWRQAGQSALAEALIRYERARVSYLRFRDERMTFESDEAWILAKAALKCEEDRLVVVWRDMIHNSLKGQFDPTILHAVMDNMDEFLKRSKE
jgi:hypothetical protein